MTTTTAPHQPFPTTGILAENMNLSLTALQGVLQGQFGSVYGYIVDTIEYAGGVFVQHGSGPNFQGGVITLCTCKHQMRGGLGVSSWPGKWVAGFTGVREVPSSGLNYLVYLMRVAHAYPSHRDLWKNLSSAVREAKAADLDRLGDLYRPGTPDGDPFDPGSYTPPRSDHSHCNNGWRDDIDSVYYGRRPPLLVGDARFSFLWNRPVAGYQPPMHPRTKKHDLATLLRRLS